jgi:flagellar basal-body rod modification protein FlgD
MSTTVNSATSSLTATLGAGAADQAKPGSDAQDRFLKLLVTQMKNQDPLNPLDNAQVTSQIAQISTVTGIDKLNATLQALAGEFASTQALQASNMIGRGVLMQGTAITLDNGQAVGGVELKDAADKVIVSIRDGADHVIDSIDLGAREPGVFAFTWDGRNSAGEALPAGQYSIGIDARRGTTKIDAQPLSLAIVRSVTPDTQGALLDVGGKTAIKLSDVRHIL